MLPYEGVPAAFGLVCVRFNDKSATMNVPIPDAVNAMLAQPVKPFACTQCTARYTHPQSLRKHVKQKHPPPTLQKKAAYDEAIPRVDQLEPSPTITPPMYKSFLTLSATQISQERTRKKKWASTWAINRRLQLMYVPSAYSNAQVTNR